MEVIFLAYLVWPSDRYLIPSDENRDKVHAQKLYDRIRCNSIQECFPNEPLSGHGMGFQTSIMQSLTFLRTIPLLCEQVDIHTSQDWDAILDLPRISERQSGAVESKVVSSTSRRPSGPVVAWLVLTSVTMETYTFGYLLTLVQQCFSSEKTAFLTQSSFLDQFSTIWQGKG